MVLLNHGFSGCVQCERWVTRNFWFQTILILVKMDSDKDLTPQYGFVDNPYKLVYHRSRWLVISQYIVSFPIISHEYIPLYPIQQLHKLVGGFKHEFYFPYMENDPSHWRTHIFQDGYCTTNQIYFPIYSHIFPIVSHNFDTFPIDIPIVSHSKKMLWLLW